jgi:hypothetical protein
MPYSDARDLADYLGELAGIRSDGEGEAMTPADFKELRAMSGAVNG